MGIVLDVKSKSEVSSKPLGTPLLTESLILPYVDAKFHIVNSSSRVESTFLANLFGLSAEHNYSTVVHEVRKYRKGKTDDDLDALIGVSVRMYAALQGTDFGFDLTIPNLAASSQLDMNEVFIAVKVEGYSGHLGDLLVDPGGLDVESYLEYSQSFSMLQKAVFGEGADVHYHPQVLEIIEDATTDS